MQKNTNQAISSTVPCVSTKLKNNIQNNSISNLNDKTCSRDHWEECVLKYHPVAAAIVICESAFNVAESAAGQLAPTLACRIILATWNHIWTHFALVITSGGKSVTTKDNKDTTKLDTHVTWNNKRDNHASATTDWLIIWLTGGCLPAWLTDWLTEWLIDWLIELIYCKSILH